MPVGTRTILVPQTVVDPGTPAMAVTVGKRLEGGTVIPWEAEKRASSAERPTISATPNRNQFLEVPVVGKVRESDGEIVKPWESEKRACSIERRTISVPQAQSLPGWRQCYRR